MRGYESVRGAHFENRLAADVCLYNRYFEDLLGFVHEILGGGTPEHRHDMLARMSGTWMTGLRSRIRELSPDRC